MFKKLIPVVALVFIAACGNPTIQGYDGETLVPITCESKCSKGHCKDKPAKCCSKSHCKKNDCKKGHCKDKASKCKKGHCKKGK